MTALQRLGPRKLTECSYIEFLPSDAEEAGEANNESNQNKSIQRLRSSLNFVLLIPSRRGRSKHESIGHNGGWTQTRRTSTLSGPDGGSCREGIAVEQDIGETFISVVSEIKGLPFVRQREASSQGSRRRKTYAYGDLICFYSLLDVGMVAG